MVQLLKVYFFIFYFFFQAEDGIRDWSVTGVQTCALPIYKHNSCHSIAHVFDCTTENWLPGVRLDTPPGSRLALRDSAIFDVPFFLLADRKSVV